MSATEIIFIFTLAGIAGIIKSTAGFGYPMLMLPVLSQFIDFVDAVLIVAPSNFFLNAAIVWHLRAERGDALTLGVFTGAGVIGSIAGTLLLPWLPVEVARPLLLAILVAFLFNRLSGFRYSISESNASRYAPIVGGVAGVCQGAIGVSGPITTPWFLSLDRHREVFVYSVAFNFGVTGLVQLLVAGGTGLFTSNSLWIGMAMIAPVALSVPIGARIRHQISADAFEKFVIALLAVSGLALLLRILGIT